MRNFCKKKYTQYFLIFIIGLLLVPVGVIAHTDPVFDQTNYWFRSDDGSESTATGFGGVAQDTDIGAAADAQLRLRIGWGETAGGSKNNVTVGLEFSSDDDGTCTTGTWTQITTTSANWQLYDSANITDGEATTQQITTGTFVGGAVLDQTTESAGNSFSGNDRAEHEWTVQGNSPTAGTTYHFRVSTKQTALDNYSVCAAITVNAPPDQPTNSSPSDGATGVALNPSLTGSTYSEPDGEAHADTEWRIDDDSDFSSSVWTRTAGSAEETTTVNTTNGTFANEQSGASSLNPDTIYYWQVRYNDGTVWSDWSTATSFTTTGPTVEQSAYRFFENANSADVGSALASQDTAATLTSAGQAFRLRMLLHIGNAINLPISGKDFDLQFAEKGIGTCASPEGTYASVQGGWDISSATYDNASVVAANSETNMRDVDFKPDGTKMYMFGGGNDSVQEYALSTAWDISTATYTDNYIQGQDGQSKNLAFNDDGTKMYLLGTANDSVYQYTLSTAWDVSTASYDSVSYSVQSLDQEAFGLAFNDDGTKMYVGGENAVAVFQFSLSTAWDLSTVNYDNVSFDFSGQDSLIQGIDFRNDGSKLFLSGSGNNNIYQYSLSTAWDISTASYDSVSLSITSQDSTVGSFGFRRDTGSKLFVAGQANDTVFSYSLSPGTDIAYNANATPVDGSALTGNAGDPVHGSDTTKDQTYEEFNPFINSQSAVNDGEDGMWDFSLIDNGATGGTAFCFRAVESDGTVLDTYTQYPEITTYTESSVSISVSDGVISYGTLDANTSESTISLSDTQTVTNDGTGTIDLNIKGQDTACPWTLASTNGVDQYVHDFSTTTGSNWTALATSYQTMATGIASSGTQDFDLRITTPTDSTCADTQSTDVTVQAVAQ